MILLASEDVPPITMTLEIPPIEERCGLETTDAIADGLLVRASLDQVAELLAQFGMRWERNIYGQTIQGCGLLVFQFQGHVWTGILDGYNTDQFRDILNCYVPSSWDWKLQAEFLSQQLHTRTIHYWVDDSGITIGYDCWENGRLMERLEFDEAIWQDTHAQALLDAPERTCEPHLFESQLRPLIAAEIENAYDFVWDFLCEQQAYAAVRLNAGNIQPDDLARLDYIALA